MWREIINVGLQCGAKQTRLFLILASALILGRVFLYTARLLEKCIRLMMVFPRLFPLENIRDTVLTELHVVFPVSSDAYARVRTSDLEAASMTSRRSGRDVRRALGILKA
tara:strand:+ start:7320 stop:7649 length:330 start_codon:yes stop_codon:yes gene_type:complete